MSEDYLPISEHGLIGDLRTAVLVGTDGRIDWFRAPRYALLRLGFTNEAEDFIGWLTHRVAVPGDGDLGAGARGQRRGKPAAAGQLRRADRLELPVQQARQGNLAQTAKDESFSQRRGWRWRRRSPTGNFPQAFTHLSLISSAIDLDRARGE